MRARWRAARRTGRPSPAAAALPPTQLDAGGTQLEPTQLEPTQQELDPDADDIDATMAELLG